jgi:WD40 repeat protein
MPKIAISYRRSDSEAMTGRIFDRLIAHYGKDAVFRDIDDIPLGIDFRQHINETLLKTHILLAVIGPEWLGRHGDDARIQEEADPVRVEVETALRRRVPIIPVLIGSTKMPTAEQLPPGLKDFAFRNAVKVDTGLDFDFHMDRLVRAMDVILEKKSPPSGETKIPTPPPVKPPPLPGQSDATPAPSSKSHKIPAALFGALNLDRGAKDQPAASPGAPAAWMAMLWPPGRNGRIMRSAVAGVIVILLAVAVLSGGTGGEGKPLLALPGHTAAVTSVAYSPNSHLIVSGSSDRSLKIWDADTGRLVRTLPGDFGAVSSVAFLPDGREIVSASLNGAIIIWNAETGQPIRSLRSNANYSWQSSPSVHSIAVSPDGKRVASGGSGSTVTIWNDSSGEVLEILRGHDEDFESVAFAPDGKTVVAGSKEGMIHIWDTLAGQALRTLTGHTGRVLSVAISPDGKRLAGGGGGNAVMVWDVTSGALLRTLTSGSSEVDSIAFSPDGRRLAIGGNDAVVELMDAESGQMLRSLSGHSGAVRSLAFSPDGKRLAAGSDDNTIDVWAVR